jgi:tRNA G37 N-methylase TrmD
LVTSPEGVPVRENAFVVDVLSLFPEMFAAVSHSGVTRRALEDRALDSAAVESA